MHDITDEMITKAAQGDLESFEMIYRAASGLVYNVAYRIVSNRQDAEEVTQEVFLTVYHKLNSFRFQSSFKTWIYRVTANTAINYSKKNSKQRNRNVEYDDNLNSVPVENEAGAKLDQEHHEQKINTLLNALNPDQRACIVMRNMEGLSYQQMADTLGININTVRSRLKRAREVLLSMRKEVMSHEL